MVPVANFRPRVAVQAPWASDLQIDMAVVDACIDFCNQSQVVKDMAAPFTTVANQREYSIPDGVDRGISAFMRVWCNGVELQPLDEDAVDGPWQFVSAVPGLTLPTGTPRYFQETTSGSVSLYPVPAGVYTVNVRAAYRPNRTAAQVDDVLFQDWVEAITHGAMSRLLMTPGAPYNPQLAAIHDKLFNASANQALLQSRRGSTRAQSRVTPVHI